MTDTAVRYTSRELAQRAGVDVRAVRRWLAAGLVQTTPFRGPQTVYGPRHLDEVLAIVRFRADNTNYAGIERRLRSLSDEALAAFLRPGESGAEPSAEPTAAQKTPPAPFEGASHWERVVLLPGLELAIRSDAGPLVYRLAREIVGQYRTE
jgi:DNA-binding transcriptional MerR regulator